MVLVYTGRYFRAEHVLIVLSVKLLSAMVIQGGPYFSLEITFTKIRKPSKLFLYRY